MTEEAELPQVLAIAVDSDVAPIIAVLEQASPGAVVICRACEEVQPQFTEQISELARRRRATVWLSFGSPGDPHEDLISAEALRGLAPDLMTRDIYLCGPAQTAHALMSVLRGIGVPHQQIHIGPSSWHVQVEVAAEPMATMAQLAALATELLQQPGVHTAEVNAGGNSVVARLRLSAPGEWQARRAAERLLITLMTDVEMVPGEVITSRVVDDQHH